jgi:diacylglycerol kinase (ATP)
MSTISFIINPASGTGKVKKIPGLIHDFFRKKGGQYVIRYTEYAGHAKKIVNEEIANGSTIIVAVGGDGTVNEVATALLHSKAALGIIPTGSGNGLARHLKIPMHATKALAVIAEGNSMTIDSGEVNGKPFFCTAGIGLDAVVAERFAQIKGRGLLNYIKASLLAYQKHTVETIHDEQGNAYSGFLLSICNANQYGNNAFISPQSNVQDGKLELISISPLHWFQIPSFIIRLFSKSLDKHPCYHVTSFHHILLQRERNGALHVDGDTLAHTNSLTVRCIPKSLNVISNA